MIVRNGRGRVVYASLSLLVSLLAVFRAPTYHLWMLSIIVTEWGHMLAVLALLPFAPGWSSTRGGRYSVVISLAASFIFLTPLQRSFPVASALPQSMEAAFGPSNVTSTPLSFKNLLMGVPLTPVRGSTERYARSCGEVLSLELYRPPAALKPSPLILVVHGGSWQSGTVTVRVRDIGKEEKYKISELGRAYNQYTGTKSFYPGFFGGHLHHKTR